VCKTAEATKTSAITDGIPMTETTEVRLVEVLEKFHDQMDIDHSSVMTVEKIVAGVVMLVVTSVCLWVGVTLNSVTTTVTKLQTEMQYTSASMIELKDEVRSLRGSQTERGSENGKQISLIIDRMKTDDERETRESSSLQDILLRLAAIESAMKMNGPN